MNQNSKTSKSGRELDIIYGAEAIPNANGEGFLGLYRAPGLAPGYVRDPETNRVRFFPTEDAAIAAASLRLFDILNTPRLRTVNRSGKTERYQKLTPTELKVLVNEAGITWTMLAYLYGTSERRLTEWMNGVNDKGQEERAPHPVRVLLELFKAASQNIDIAERVTDSVTSHYSEKR
ncbi:hypothetical protein GR212_15695 [Rhizobium lusitanum]|uniref:Uncharacterized protein n=1 Tax=Rhizobium lusitanum TaxID=293958 RepID=A0A6L9U9N0_9HYPH|nr:hypothetical protein [Rhizobium lusitanum]NEI71022.1 hypothetical protein [Rhizobium lusitanum]